MEKDNNECQYFTKEELNTLSLGLLSLINRVNTALDKGFYVDTLGGSKKKKRKTYPQDIKRLIYLRNGGCCSICGKRMSLDECNLDHRIPLSKGGIDAVENLDCVHVKCNYIKADLMPDELEKGIKDIFLYQMEKNSGYKLRYRIAKAVLRKIC